MRKINTLFAALAVILILAFSAISPPTMAAAENSMQILIIGDASIGKSAVIAAIAEHVSVHNALVVPVEPPREINDLRREHPVIVERAVMLVSAIFAPESVPIKAKSNNQPAIQTTDYEKPPNLIAYRGISFSNRVRADTA